MYQQPMPPAPPTYAPAPPPGSVPFSGQRQRGPRLAALVIAVLLVTMLAVSTVSGAVGKARDLAYPMPRLGQVTFNNSSGSSDTTVHSGDALTFSVAVFAGNDLSYFWNFGDGTSGTGSQPTHTYDGYASQLGVSVRVTDPLGQTATARPLVLSVLPPPPTASFVFDYANSYCYSFYNECYVYVDASNSSAGASDVGISYSWQWGDGYTENDDSYSQTYHVYPDQSATYTITLTVADQFGQSSSASNQITITTS